MAIYPKQTGKTLTVANQTANGALTVTGATEQYRVVVLNQTTANISLTLPSPSDPNVVFTLDLVNKGTADVTVAGAVVKAGKINSVIHEGSVWRTLSTSSSSSVSLDYAIINAGNTVGSSSLYTTVSLPGYGGTALSTVMTSAARLPLTSAGWTQSTLTESSVSGPTVSANQVTIAKSGRYQIIADISLVSVSNTNITQIVKNGTTILAYQAIYAGAQGRTPVAAVFFGDLVAGDTIDLRVGGHSTGTLTVDYFHLSIQQIANASVVDPTLLTPTTLNNGSAFMSASSVNGNNAIQTLVTFTLPAAGTYELDYFAAYAANSGAGDWRLFLADSTLVVITDTERTGMTNDAGRGLSETHGTHTITVTGATILNLRATATATNSTFNNSAGVGRTGVIWRQLPTATVAYVPSALVDYLSGSLVTAVNVATNAAIPFDTVSGNLTYSAGLITLLAGKTYRLVATSVSGTLHAFKWLTAANVAISSSTGVSGSIANQSGSFETIYTPAVDTQVKLAPVNGSTLVGVSSGYTSFSITQIGSSSVSTVAVNDQAASGYFDVGAMRIQFFTASVQNGTAVTLPVPFANANYKVTASVNSAIGVVYAGSQSKTTTGFQAVAIQMSNSSGYTSGLTAVDYIAIGLKP